MIDYGKIAFNRSEDAIKENLKKTIIPNFKRYYVNGNCNQNLYLATILVLEQKPIHFNFKCNLDCLCQIFINQKLEYALNVNGEAQTILNLSETNNIEVKFISSTQEKVCCEIFINGQFEQVEIEKNYLYTLNNSYCLTSTYNNKTKILKSDSISEIIANKNLNNLTECEGYVAGTNANSDFYYIKNLSNNSYLVNSTNEVKLNKFINYDSIISFNNSENCFFIFSLENYLLKVLKLSVDGQVLLERNFKFYNGIYASKLFPVITQCQTSNNYFIFCDVNFNFYVVLCNNNIVTDLSQNFIRCIALSVKGINACGYLNNTQLKIVVCTENKVHELNLSITMEGLKKSSDLVKKNLTNKILINNNNYILDFNGFMIQYETT